MLVLDDESCTQMLLMPAKEIRQRLSKYGASLEPPHDDAIVHPTDDDYAFFEKVCVIFHIERRHVSY